MTNYVIYDGYDAISKPYEDEKLARLRASEMERVFHRPFDVKGEPVPQKDFSPYARKPEECWTYLITLGYDGDDLMKIGKLHGWKPISSWGQNGWNLGSWPYDIIYFRTQHQCGEQVECYEVMRYVEGDVFYWVLPTEEVRDDLVNHIAFDGWKMEGCGWVVEYETVEDLPPEFKGPCHW